MEKYLTIPFSEIVITQKGKNPIIKSNKKLSEYIPYIDIKAFEQGIFDTYTDGQKCLLCDDGDVLLVWDGARAGLAGTAYKGAVGSTLMKVNVPYLERKYILFFIQLYSRDLNAQPKGTGIPHINPNIFNSLPFFLPPFQEQNRIVAKIDSLFSELDSNIKLLKNIKTQLAIYRQSVLKWAFEGKLTEEWRNKNKFDSCETVLENVKIINKNERTNNKLFNIDQEFPLYDLPKEWKWVSIGNISKGVEYGTSAKSSKNGKTVVLRMGNIQNGIFIYNDLVYTSNKKEIEKYKLYENDVLFNRTNSPELVGKTALYSGAIPSIFAGYLIRLNQISYINAKYLTYFLNSPHAKECGNIAKTDGVNQSNINGTKLSSYPFPLCSKPEQFTIVSAIESRLSVCDKIEQTIDQTLALSDQLRQSILKKAFEGRLVPQDPNDEPAEKLLERIKAEKTAILEKQKTGHRMKRINTNKKRLSNKANDKEKTNLT